MIKRNIAQLGQFRTPIGGLQGNILNPMVWVKGILGVIFLVIITTIALFIVGRVLRGARVEPAAPGLIKRII